LTSPQWRIWCESLYEKYEHLFHHQIAIDKGTWILLASIIEKYNVKKVAEFGAGLSTVLMDRLGVSVTSFENFPEYLPTFELNNSKIVDYNPFVNDGSIMPVGDMAFIDGPVSLFGRDVSYELVSQSSIPLMVSHDTDKAHIQDLIMRLSDDWHTVGMVEAGGRYIALAMMRNNDVY